MEDQSFLAPKQLCTHQMQFNDQEQNLRLTIDCLQECPTLTDINRHKKKCCLRNQNKGLESAHTHETARVLWTAIKNLGLASSLLKTINDDLSTGSCAEFGITKLHSNVGVKGLDVYGLDNSATLHFAKKHEKHLDRRGKDLINLNSEDIRLIAGPGQSINVIRNVVTELHKQHIPTEKRVVEKIRSERQNVMKLCENIICRDVQRRSKNQTGHSHLGSI